jgi:tetratricopeptide (TPR) repeat protein
MFLIPLWYWNLTKPQIKHFVLPRNAKDDQMPLESPGTGRIMAIIGIGVFCSFSIIFLINYWNADIAYGWGYNYNRINAYTEANPYLEKAVKMRGGEDLYKNELSINLAALTILAAQQQDANTATQFATRAKILSDEVARDNPNNVVYWKARTRVLFSLAELSPQLLPEAVEAIDRANALAPTDAKIIYNQALIYDQTGKKDEALKLLDKAVQLKPNYRDAYYAKALFLTQLAEENKDNPKGSEYNTQAKKILNFIIENIAPQDQQANDLLKTLN